jgi:dephospho-CoA kinase
MMFRLMFAGRAVIGIAGGIGSGKTFVAQLFAAQGCFVIYSDQLVADAYRDPAVVERLRNWWGDDVVGPDGNIDKRFIASKVFDDKTQRQRLEQLIHPIVDAERRRRMAAAGSKSKSPPVAFVWDTPLLFESGLNLQCDAVVFVDAPLPLRQQRVRQSRGWDAQEIPRREISQWPLDRKLELSDYVISNTAEAAGDARGPVESQVRSVLSRILAKAAETT